MMTLDGKQNYQVRAECLVKKNPLPNLFDSNTINITLS